MRAYTIIRDGCWTGRVVRCDADQVANNTPAGCEAVEGEPDDLIASGDVLPRDPADVAAEAAIHARADLIQQITALEDAAARPLRELLLDPTDATARGRLAALNAQIAALRAALPPIHTGA